MAPEIKLGPRHACRKPKGIFQRPNPGLFGLKGLRVTKPFSRNNFQIGIKRIYLAGRLDFDNGKAPELKPGLRPGCRKPKGLIQRATQVSLALRPCG
jgi:hypothetical protein